MLSAEDQDLVEVVIACANGQMGRAIALEILDELHLAGFEIVRKSDIPTSDTAS